MKIEKKWSIKTAEEKIVDFYPVFIPDIQGNVNCKTIRIKEGENEYTFSYDNFLQFCYFIGNEEQRRKLINIQMKGIREIPYNVMFKLNEIEKKEGIARRKIILTIDELVAAYCRIEAQKFVIKQKLRQRDLTHI